MKYYSIIALMLLLAGCAGEEKLPILGERDVVERTVNGEKVIDTVYKTIPPFSFINQDSVMVTNHNFDGKIYVADFFFTTCPTICPTMHRNMLKVYNQFKNNPEVKFLSHSIDSKYDTPPVLKQYANKLGLSGTQWEFVNGPRASIYDIANNNYLVGVDAHAGDDSSGFVHQGWFILVDKEKRLRGSYEGTSEEEVLKMAKDMELLLKEYRR